ncbi:MAG: hypothetical protein ACFE9I_18875 [Candidatus Hermodarchaeota archaeon]
MIFQETPFQYFSFFDAVEMGLYYIIVGYFVLLFFYFLFIRYRTSKKLYWLFFSILFLCFGISRVFFIVYYFYAPELYTGTNGEDVVAFLMLNYRLATFFTWMGTACAVGVLGILLFPPDSQVEKSEREGFSIKYWFNNKNNVKIMIRIGLFIIPVIIGFLTLTLPDNLFIDPDFVDTYSISIVPINVNILGWEYPVGRFLWNFIFIPLFVALIPFIFIYLAWKTFGVLRRSYALNAIGFFLYFIGRILQGALDIAALPHFRAVLPPLIILLALLILVIANTYEQLK